MNNVGALALLMPVAIQIANRLQFPPGKILMPLAFGSILGGMTTLIGTPPNLIVSGFRAEASGTGFSMFDFAPVGVPVAVAGLIFLCSDRLAPGAAPGAQGNGRLRDRGLFHGSAGARAIEVAGMTLRQIEIGARTADAQVVGLIRNERRIPPQATFAKCGSATS